MTKNNTKSQAKLKDDGERMIPSFHKGTVMYAEHMTRYVCAQEICKDKTVLDIASGSGYGTQLLAHTASFVYGVDVDKRSVEYAKQNYQEKNIQYLAGDGVSIPLDDNSVERVVTLETIEHVENYKKFLSEIRRVLTKDGLAIVSTPNKLEFTQGNHFHLYEFEYEELLNLLKKEFKYVDSYFQATWVTVAVASEKEIKTEGTIENIQTINMKPLDRDKYLYFYFVCSNRPITEKITSLNAFGGHYSAKELTEIDELNKKNIADYKVVLANLEDSKTQLRSEYETVVENLKNEIARLESQLEKRFRLKNTKALKSLKKIKHKIIK
jgi:ubiquinone/menaquinone biosynthesis C-methylase UbiE